VLVRSHPGGVPERPELPQGVPESRPAWAPWTAPVALLAGLTVTLFAGLGVAIVLAVIGVDVNSHQSTVDIVGTFLQDAALIGTAIVFAGLSGGRWRPEQFGLRATRIAPAVGWATLGLLASLIFTGLWSALLQNHQKEQIVHQLGADHPGFARYAVALLVCVVAPMAEEFFFRGYFFTALRNWRGTPLAVVLTGLTFGAVHLGSAPVVYLVPLAFLGMVLCGVYLRTRSLYPCIGLHVVNNSLAFGVSENWDWQIPVLVAVSLALVGLVGVGIARWRPAPAVFAAA
jgi:membrane protease YdiL (CAAX protease family)